MIIMVLELRDVQLCMVNNSIIHFKKFKNKAMEKFKSCIDACLACVVTCENCVTDCIKDNNQACIVLCRDCADICSLCARFQARESRFQHDLHILCAKICKACAAECLKHAAHHISCKNCAEACKKCADLCEELSMAKL
jgi:hypothetical protein